MTIDTTGPSDPTTETAEPPADSPPANSAPAATIGTDSAFTDDELQDIAQFVDSDLLALLGQC